VSPWNCSRAPSDSIALRDTLPDGVALHVLNLHLKSKIPTDIPGQHPSQFRWHSASGWAEGAFISAMKRMGQALETRILIDRLFDADANARIAVCGDFNADLDEVPMEAIRGDVENTGNPALVSRLMVPCERNIPASARFSLYHHGRPVMLDHILVSRPLLAYWQGSAAHNEILHDESVAFAVDTLFPESDHAAVMAEFLLP
jgi:predicted extracellular nuclease